MSRWLARAVAGGDLYLGPRPGLMGRKLSRLALYATNRCNARCRICGQWRKEPKVDLSPQIVADILASKCLYPLTHIELEGGEFLLHPRYREILPLMSGRNYSLLSNGIQAGELIEAVRQFRIPHLTLSLDGRPETHARVRGVDAYGRVLRIVEELKDEPGLEIRIIFTFNPWNGRADYDHVRELCRRYGLTMSYNIYSDMAYFDTDRKPAPIPFSISTSIPTSMDGHNPYLSLYNPWLEGRVKVPCLSIRSRLAVYPNGDVPLCQQKNVILGNLHHRSLDEIWNDPQTIALQREHTHCNACWVSYHRPYDLRLIEVLEKVLTPWLAKKLLGEYQMTNG